MSDTFNQDDMRLQIALDLASIEDRKQCPVEGCMKFKGKKSKYCAMHQSRVYKYGTTDGRQWPTVCEVDGCSGRPIAKGKCQPHYDRLRRRGTFEPVERMTLRDRIERKVTHEDRGHTSPCWIYDGAANSSGYMGMKVGHLDDRRTDLVHRVAYREYRGPIPDGLVIDHLCRVRACCNPNHLEAVSQSENVRRSWEAGQ